MATGLSDLRGEEPIVDPLSGRPSPYFLRYLMDRGGFLTSQEKTLATLQTTLAAKADKTTKILTPAAGGLSGGGDLSTDRSLSLPDTAVTPGAYTNASITVDQKGRLTAAASGAGGGGGGFTLLEQHTAAASASLNFTTAISATYDEYLIEFLGIQPATNTVGLFMRMSTNGGTTYDATAIYGYQTWASNSFTAGNQINTTAANQIRLANSNIDNTSTASLNGVLRLFNPTSTTLHKAVAGQFGFVTSAIYENSVMNGAYRSTTAVNAFQFLFSAGNIAAGTIRVYGIPKT